MPEVLPFPVPVRFQANVNLGCARLDLEKVAVEAKYNPVTRQVSNLEIFLYGCSYTDYLTWEQMEDLEEHAAWIAEKEAE